MQYTGCLAGAVNSMPDAVIPHILFATKAEARPLRLSLSAPPHTRADSFQRVCGHALCWPVARLYVWSCSVLARGLAICVVMLCWPVAWPYVWLCSVLARGLAIYVVMLCAGLWPGHMCGHALCCHFSCGVLTLPCPALRCVCRPR